MLFDLDGTLVQTESLKAESYAQAAGELRPGIIDPLAVVRSYDRYVGLSREAVAQELLTEFDLTEPAARIMSELGASSPRDAFIALRLRIYESMIADGTLVRRQELPYATGLVRKLGADGVTVGLTTVSHAAQAMVVLRALGIQDAFDIIVTIDDVTHGKPDPEIYMLATARVGIAPVDCLAVEDSVPGIQAAVAAGMQCVASTNQLTRESVHQAMPMQGVCVVDDPTTLESVVRSMLTTRDGAA